MPPRFYERPGLNIASYDDRAPGGDLAFYLKLAGECGGPVLDIACGTGRLAFPLAHVGFDVTGIDLSEGMLTRAREKAVGDAAARDRLRFVAGDMTSFELGQEFGLAIIAFRSFQMLLTPEAERACLETVLRHLRPGGRLVVALFDPLLHLLTPGGVDPTPPELWRSSAATTATGVEVTVLDRVNDPLEQVLTETWRFGQLDERGAVVREETEVLKLRWLYRYEMRYLLELCGFEVEAEYSDFDRSPPAYGREQVWVARRPLAGNA
jgi:SAM-dependent methyltransferase